jgi:ABC-type nitrate/sulfonate/bicarbonate transport system substrate-binding protein
MKRNTLTFFLAFGFFVSCFDFSAQAATKVSFPFTPISGASLPWWIAKESRFYEKHGLDVDMIYVGASPVIIQAMLGGQAGVGAGGGPPLVTNVLQGGDIVQVATTIPYAIQSLIVKADIKTPADLAGKKIGISRLGAFRTTRCKPS